MERWRRAARTYYLTLRISRKRARIIMEYVRVRALHLHNGPRGRGQAISMASTSTAADIPDNVDGKSFKHA